MRAQVSEIISRYNMLLPGERIGVAVSGGADSICLLYILHEMAQELGVLLAVVHLNHGLRGAESDEDEIFVREQALRLQLPFHSSSADLHAIDTNIEQAGRIARQTFFRSLRQSGHLDKVATGHTRSDQAETVLYRLLRGSGTAGLSGIRPVTSDGLIRPLLWISRQQVEDFLRTKDLTWREDRTNSDQRFSRNQIRHELLPLLKNKYSPAAVDILAGTAEVARDEEEFWTKHMEKLSSDLFQRRGSAVLVRAADLIEKGRAEARRMIRFAAGMVKGDLRSISLQHVEAILDLAGQKEGHGRLQIPGLDVFRSFEWLRFAPIRTSTRAERDYGFSVRVPESIRLPDSENRIELALMDWPGPGAPPPVAGDYNTVEWWIDPERLEEPIELRNWRPGDAIERPSGAERIKSLFQNARVPIWDRQGWPVLTSRGRIIWARRFGVACDVGPNESCRRAVRVREMARID